MTTTTTTTTTTLIPPAKTLDGRLLCAAACAYEYGDGGEDEFHPYYQAGAGYIIEPKRYTVGVNSCLVGLTQDGIVLAFRGTTERYSDWWQNVAVTMIEEPLWISGGKIHRGYYQAIVAMKGGIKELLLELLHEHVYKTWSYYFFRYQPKIYLTGHSKGGCLASLYALELKRDAEILPNPTTYVCTFGSPRVGDLTFAKEYDQTISQTSYENHLDIIPFLPPGNNDRMQVEETEAGGEMKISDSCDNSSETAKPAKKKWWNYAPIGHRKYINSEGTVVHKVSKELDMERIRQFELKTVLKFSEFRRAHCSGIPDMTTLSGSPTTTSSKGGSYFNAIAPDICSLAAAMKPT